MSEESVTPPEDQGKGSAIWGVLLLLPGILACVATLVVPSLSLFRLSLLDVSFTDASFIGLENYRIFGDEVFRASLGFTLLMGITRLVVVAIVPLLLALAVNEFGRVGRIVARLVTTVPLAFFAPTAVAVAWRGVLLAREGFALAENPRRTLLLIDSAVTFGLACGLGLIVYLAALRSAKDEAPTWSETRRPLLVTWAVGLAAAVALTLQAFTLPMVMTGWQLRTSTLATTQYVQSFRFLRFGTGAALALPTLLMLALLGLGVAAILAFGRLRVDTVPAGKQSPLLSQDEGFGAARIVAVIVAVLVGVLLCRFSMWPALRNAVHAVSGGPADTLQQIRIPILQAAVNTLVPPLLGVLFVQMPLTYLTAFAIGALRPLGKRSEALLLLFAPWLFVTTGPLSPVFFRWLLKLGLAGTFIGLIPPFMLSIPILFILTLFFKGRAPAWQAAREEGKPASSALFSAVILPSLPLAALLALAAVHFSAWDMLWGLVAGGMGPESETFSTALLRLVGQFSADLPMIGMAVVLLWLPVSVVFFVVYGVFQAVYLDRLALVRDAE